MADPRADSSPHLGVVLIAEDPIVREALGERLRRAGAQVLLSLGSAAELSESAPAPQAEAIVWDLGLRPDDLLDPDAPIWRQRLPLLAIVPDPSSATDALSLGVRGAVSRDATDVELIAAVRAVATGLIVTSASLRPEPSTHRRVSAPATDDLTPREAEVLSLLVEGLSNKQIAAHLGISEHTAKFHVNALPPASAVTRCA